MNEKISRRTAIKCIGGSAIGLAGLAGLWKREELLVFFERDKRAAEQEPERALQVDTRLYQSNGAQLSMLGFGAMRLPTHVIGGEKAIDEEVAEKMIDYAYRHGVNYFDTAYIYHGGKSEGFLGKALKKYPRDSFYLADKMPGYMVESLAQAKDIFQEQLDRCQVEYFDNYFLHSLNKQDNFEKVYLQEGVLAYLQSEKARGRIRQLGFSYHGEIPFFYELMDHYPWDCVMIQLNYLDWNGPEEIPEAGEHTKIVGSLYRKAEEKHVPCFVMEPVKGGRLASLPEAAEKVLKEREPNRSIASWAMRYAAFRPGVVTVLSGMSELNQVVDNINTMADFKPLSAQDEALVQRARNISEGVQDIPCTYCSYCMPCPYGVDIPANFKVYNDWAVPLNVDGGAAAASEQQKKEFLTHYHNEVMKAARADHCIRCNQCLKLCPQQIQIPQQLRKLDLLVQSLEQGTRKGVMS